MDFGKLPDVDRIDFRLPPDRDPERSLGGGRSAADLDLRIGLAGWADPGFVGRLYPRGVQPRDFLACHAQVLRTNELNSTYYGVSEERLGRWRDAVGPDFTLCPKLPSAITHDAFLRDVDDAMERFLGQLEALGPACGRVWAALPPGFGPDLTGTLIRFVETWCPRVPLALEFRHPDWFRGGRGADAAFEALEANGGTAILCDVAGRRDVLHMRVAGPEVFLRWVGNRQHPSDAARLDAWAARLAAWAERGLERAWVFLHQPDDPDAVVSAEHLARRWREVSGVDPLPGLGREPIPPGGLQGELF